MASPSSARIAIDIGIVVDNLETSLQFYRDRLGLNIVGELNTSLIGTGKMVQLQHGASLIKLVEFTQTPGAPAKGIASSRGLRYLTLMVTTIHNIAARLEQAAVSTVIPLTELANGAAILMVEDPDGNVVEFVQEKQEADSGD